MASLDDILTTQKNGVVAISSIAQTLSSWLGWTKGTVIPRTAGSVSTATLYTVPTGYSFTLTDLEICNTSGSSQTFTIYIVPSGGTASASNALFYSAPIKGNTTVQWTGSQSLDVGSSIQASASATSVTFMVNGGKA
jgi:hypothetical protein